MIDCPSSTMMVMISGRVGDYIQVAQLLIQVCREIGVRPQEEVMARGCIWTSSLTISLTFLRKSRIITSLAYSSHHSTNWRGIGRNTDI